MLLREQDKHFLWSLLTAVGVIFVWKGIWEGIYELPILGNEWVLLFLGLAMLTFSGLIFKEFDPLGGIEKSVAKLLHNIYNADHREEYQLKYYDQHRKQSFLIKGQEIQGLEKNVLILKQEHHNQEVFIPFHRITEIIHLGKTCWRL